MRDSLHLKSTVSMEKSKLWFLKPTMEMAGMELLKSKGRLREILILIMYIERCFEISPQFFSSKLLESRFGQNLVFQCLDCLNPDVVSNQQRSYKLSPKTK